MSRFQPKQHRLAIFWNEKCVPADIHSSKNYNRSSCEHFGRCFINPQCLSVVQAFLSPFFWSTNHPRRFTARVVFTCTRLWTHEEAAMQTNQSEIQSEPKWPVEQVGVQCLAQGHITTDPLISGAPSLSPEPRRHRCSHESLQVCCWAESDG